MSEPLVRHRRQRLSVTLPAAPLCVEADQARLVQVFVNLLNNAAKYTPEGRRVGVAAAREGDEAVVRVSDDGCGIPADKLHLVFELFTQLDFGPDRPEAGLGIGLSLVRRLVEMHGGSITASSAGPDRGSEFTVRLPATESAALGGGPATECGPQPGRHILIVEDNRDGRDSLARLLTVLGHRVDVAEDGPRGVDAALSLRPEVALIDIGLPGLNGYGVASKVRAALGTDVLLVALTGYAHPDDRLRAREAGFDAHLPKPVELDDLHHLLARPGCGPASASA
jgi:CheY-like chemotaxis protein